MKHSFVSVFICMITLMHCLEAGVEKIASSAHCPERPPIHSRGPPGIPGRPGKKFFNNRKVKESN